MKLKRLTLWGFKSFRDRTVVDFKEGMTAIVGPNGCGKSNIMDALKWVLGESSPKALRGGKMPDILFGGTEKSKGKGAAEVRALFECAGDPLGIGANEIEIIRRLGSEGSSDYLVNNKNIRLKDLHLLLHRMGLGKEGFWMFEQGRVDQVVSWDPEERRAVFEESSGISLYLSQKREALEKLKETEIALDKLFEREKEALKLLEILKAQADATDAYLKVKERSHVVEKELYTGRLYAMDEGLVKEEAKLKRLQVERKNLQEEGTSLQEEQIFLKTKIEALREEKRRIEEKLLHLHHTLENEKRELDGLISKSRGIESLIRDRKGRIEREEKGQSRLQEELIALQKEGQTSTLESLKEKLEAKLRLREVKELELEKVLIDEKKQEEERVERLKERHLLEKQLLSLAEERKRHEEYTLAQGKISPLESLLAAKKGGLRIEDKGFLLTSIEDKAGKLSISQKWVQELSLDEASLIGRMRSLEGLIKMLPGPPLGNRKVLEWANDPSSPFFGKAAPLLKKFPLSSPLIEKGQALLGAHMDAIALDRSLDISSLKDLPFSIYVGTDLEQFLSGWFSDWKVQAKVTSPPRQQLEEEVEKLKLELHDLLTKKKEKLQEASALEKSVSAEKVSLKLVEKEELEKGEEIRRLEWELQQAKTSLKSLEEKLNPFDPDEEKRIGEALKGLVILSPQSRGIGLKQELDRLRKEERELRDDFAASEAKREEREKKRLLKEREVEEKEREKGRLKQELKELTFKLSELPKQIDPLKATNLENQKILREEKADLELRKGELTVLEKQELENMKKGEENSKNFSQISMDEEKSKGALGSLQEKKSQLLADIFENLGYLLEGKKTETPLGDLEKEWKEIRQKLESFTDISLTALERYRKEVEEGEILRKQIVDLEGACQKAFEWIEELDNESIKRFLEVFEAVGRSFGEAFKKLFKGGEARLKMTKPLEPLTSGIEIEAEPPGKALRSIKLLSGGEKCLVGIALLIALFSVKKAPIALFDEVDAPLDEANLMRFLDLLVPFSSETQVVLITHKRQTMEAASGLLGVTMAERGISRVLPLALKAEAVLTPS